MSTHRLILNRISPMTGAASSDLMLPGNSRAQSSRVQVGFMPPYTGIFSQLGAAIENGCCLAIDEQGGKLGERNIEYFKIDDETDLSKGIENANPEQDTDLQVVKN